VADSDRTGFLAGLWRSSNRLQRTVVIGTYSVVVMFSLYEGDGLLSPITAVFALCEAFAWTITQIGWVMVAWYVSAFVSSVVVFKKYTGTLSIFRQTVLAIFLGLTPQVVFVLFVNGFGAPGATRPESVVEQIARTYENFVWTLQCKLGKYLLPSFFAGASLSILMFWLTRKCERLKGAWERVRNSARFTGLVLVSATTFTVMTSLPAGEWQPDSRILLSARIKQGVEATAKLALYQTAIAELRAPNSPFKASLNNAAQALPVHARPPSGLGANAQEVQDAVDVVREKMPRHDGGAPVLVTSSVSRTQARDLARELGSEARAANDQTEAARREIAEIFGSGAGTVAGKLAGAPVEKLAGALVEDAATRLAEMLLARDTIRDAAAWIGKSVPDKTREVMSQARASAQSLISSTRDVLAAPTFVADLHARGETRAKAAGARVRAAEAAAADLLRWMRPFRVREDKSNAEGRPSEGRAGVGR
jgi:hypothetical protein